MLCSKRLPYVLHAVWQQGELFTTSVAKVAQIFIDDKLIMEFSELIKISRVDNVVVYKPFQEPTMMSLGITGHHLILANDIMKSQQLLVSKKNVLYVFRNAANDIAVLWLFFEVVHINCAFLVRLNSNTSSCSEWIIFTARNEWGISDFLND